MTAPFPTVSLHCFWEWLLLVGPERQRWLLTLCSPFLLHSTSGLASSDPESPQHLLQSRSAVMELPSVCPQDAITPEGCFTGRGLLADHSLVFHLVDMLLYLLLWEAMSGFKCDLVMAAVWLSSLCLWCVCCSWVWIGTFHHNWGIFSHYFFQYFYALILNILCIINILLAQWYYIRAFHTALNEWGSVRFFPSVLQIG